MDIMVFFLCLKPNIVDQHKAADQKRFRKNRERSNKSGQTYAAGNGPTTKNIIYNKKTKKAKICRETTTKPV